MPLQSKIKPDFSSRGKVEQIPSEPPRTLHPAAEKPTGDGKPHDYNKAPELPNWASNVKKAEDTPAPVAFRAERIGGPVAPIAPPNAPTSSFSPNLETFPTIGTSYFPGIGGGTGATGPAGNASDTGATGTQGAQGDTGYTGATGITGPAGTASETGATGATGTTGYTGYTGATGITGPAGTASQTGATGTQGAQGDTGATGDTGAKGDAGNNGGKGDTGSTGTQGATGPAGAGGGVNTLNGLVGDVFLVGTATITISPTVPGASDIQIDAPGLGVSTDTGVDTAWGTANTALANAAAAQGTADTAVAAAAAAQFTADAASGAAAAANVIATGAAATAATALAQSGVTSVNSGTGAITVQAGEGSITVGTSGSVITISNTLPGVTSVNSGTGAITVQAGTGGVTVETIGSVITISASPGGVPTEIAQGGASVACDADGNILMTTASGSGTQNITAIADDTLALVANIGDITLSAGGSVNIFSYTPVLGGDTGLVGATGDNGTLKVANISTNTISIRDGLTLEGAGTITINSSSGAPGQVIGIPLGATYPEWTTATLAGGIYPLAGTEGTTITFDVPGMNASGIVMPVYIQPGLVGGQWIKSVTPGAGSATIEVGLATTAGDSIIWSVISFGTP